MDARLPAHVEALGLIRQAQAQSGFGTVIQKGDRDAGAIMVVLSENGTNARVYERVPQLDGSRIWHRVHEQSTENATEISEYLDRRGRQDRDLWIIELDIANGERLIGLEPPVA